jgi:hypothetical protein
MCASVSKPGFREKSATNTKIVNYVEKLRISLEKSREVVRQLAILE